MTILLHGENIVASRNRLVELKTVPDSEVIEVETSDLTNEKIAQLSSPSSLFAKNRLLVIWEDRKLSSPQVKKLQETIPDLKVEEFKLDPVVFRFLEALQPGGQKKFLPLWQQYVKNEPVEIASTMLVRQFRFLLLAKIGGKLGPDDFQSLALWQLDRLKKQANLFPLEKLQEILKRLLEIDFATKSGQSPNNLQTSLELLLLNL